MRRETINTFSDGMSLDLNPLGTPAKTLTNCLNGTLITYNGNELTLQNDMGNAEIGTAALHKGYVPIGMKEYGGIIYVASYNPETKKGQLGCFPSPQQIYTSEAAQTIIDINIQQVFIDMINGFPYIKLNEYKEEIFKDSISQEPRVFNSGDLFIIKTEENFSDLFRQALDENIITIKLQVIPKLGGDFIDISNCQNCQLKLYEDITEHKNLWIFQNGGNMYDGLEENIPFDVLISEYPQYMQSYPRNIGPGVLQIQIEFNMFKLFNLYNKIEKKDNQFTIQFIGQAKADDTDECAKVQDQDLIPLSLIGSVHYIKHQLQQQFYEIPLFKQSQNILEAQSTKYQLNPGQTLYYDILPASKWGIADKTFLKSGELSYDNILNLQDKISDWNFEINSSEVLLKWKFISLSNNIDHIRFVFIPLDQVLDNEEHVKSKNVLNSLFITDATTENSQYIYKIVKPYFPIDSEHLASNYIYLCRIDIIYKDSTVRNASDYKLLYTGTFFNDKDISQFDYNHRPEIFIETDVKLHQEQTLISKQYTLLKEEESGVTNELRQDVQASDVMLLANESNINKLIGVTTDYEYEINSYLNVNKPKSIKYQDKNYSWKSFSGNLDEDKLLSAFSSQNEIKFKITSNTDYQYNQVGDELIEQCKKDYIEQEEINGVNISTNPELTFTKNSSGKYINTSVAKIHRGTLSRLGQPEDVNVVHQGLYPVYEEEDRAYNDQLFGFRIDENFIYNCILFKKQSISNYAIDIKSYGKNDNHYPYSEGAVVQGNSGFISQSAEYDEEDIFQTIQNMGNRPINICVTNQEQDLKDKFNSPFSNNIFAFQLTMPHEICFNTKSKTGDVYQSNMMEHSERFKERNLGYSSWEDSQSFFSLDKTNNCMSVMWRTQYGPRLINIATPLNIENEETEGNVITIKRKPGTTDKFTIYTDNKKHTFANMHLRAEKLLLCMLSQILIAKCKNSTLRLNTPDDLYNTDVFSNDLLLSLNKTNNISLNLNGKDIEKALSGLLSVNVLENSDIFIPKFIASIVDTHLIIRDQEYNSKLNDIFSGSEYPYFSSIGEEELVNIYPGKIISLENGYICRLEKNYDGTYAKNTSLINNEGKFYKIFLPTLISEANDPESQFNCKNTDTYKFMLEGLSYNEILIPTTKILEMQNTKISQLRSQDSDNPQFNLLYYNAFTKQKSGSGAITLFGDQSAYVQTTNFNPTSNFPAPVLDTDAWKDVEVLLDKKSTEPSEESEENTEE